MKKLDLKILLDDINEVVILKNGEEIVIPYNDYLDFKDSQDPGTGESLVISPTFLKEAVGRIGEKQDAALMETK